MKKKVVTIFMAALLAASVMSGCGQKDAASGTSASAEADTEIPASELLKATDYDVDDYVKLNDYKNMTVELSSDYEISDADVQSYIEYMMTLYPEYEATDKTTVETDDIVNIDYVGKIDGEEFDGGSDQGAHLTIGSGQFIDGFEDGLIGVTVGETVDLNLAFPEDYSNTDLAGKDVVFTVTVNSIDTEVEMTYADMTDEWVSENFAADGYTTGEELEAAVKSGLETQSESNKTSAIRTAVLEKLVDECEVTLPDGLLDERLAEYKERVNEAVEESGSDFETYMGMTEDDFNEQAEEYIQTNLIQELILEAIVKDMDLSITQSAYDSFVSAYISNYGIEDEDAFYEQYGSEDYVKLSYAENMALTELCSSVKTTVAESTDETTGTDDTSSADDQTDDGSADAE